MSKVLLVQILLAGLTSFVTSEVELEEVSAPVVPNGSSGKYNLGQCELTTNGSFDAACIVDVDFGGIRVETDGAFVGRGVCVFTVLENVTVGNLNVNVTFYDAILTFSNRDVLNLTSSSAGDWYFSESLVDYFVGDVLTYVFDVEWDTVNFPKGTCLANIACDVVIPTTTTTTATGQPLPPVD